MQLLFRVQQPPPGLVNVEWLQANYWNIFLFTLVMITNHFTATFSISSNCHIQLGVVVTSVKVVKITLAPVKFMIRCVINVYAC